MVWWIVAGVPVAALLVLAAVAAALRRRLAELDRVTGLARERVTRAQGLQAAVAGVQARVTAVQSRVTWVSQRSAALQRRLARRGPGPPGP